MFKIVSKCCGYAIIMFFGLHSAPMCIISLEATCSLSLKSNWIRFPLLLIAHNRFLITSRKLTLVDKTSVPHYALNIIKSKHSARGDERELHTARTADNLHLSVAIESAKGTECGSEFLFC